LIQGGLASLRANQCRKSVHALDTILNFFELTLSNQVDLIDDNAVSERYLMLGLVDAIVRFHIVKMDVDVLGVNETDYGVDSEVLLYERVVAKSEADGARVGEACGLNDNGVEFFAAGDQLAEGAH
jgi:hypothetical protein